MLVLVKTSAACLLMTIYMAGFYYRKPHIPVKSTRIFQWLISVAIVSSTFDLITICTVNRRDVVPDWLNLIAHIIYLLSILAFIYLLFVYMRSYLEAELKFSKNIRIFHSLACRGIDCGYFCAADHVCAGGNDRLFFRTKSVCIIRESGNLSRSHFILLSPLLEDYGQG